MACENRLNIARFAVPAGGPAAYPETWMRAGAGLGECHGMAGGTVPLKHAVTLKLPVGIRPSPPGVGDPEPPPRPNLTGT